MCVFVAVSKLCDGVVGAAMAERLELAGCARWRQRNEKWADELVGQARGGVHIMACASGDRRRVSPTRRTFYETVITVANLNSDSVIHHPTDRRCLTVISS